MKTLLPLAAGALAVWLGAALWAQQKPSASEPPTDPNRIILDVTRVNMLFTVTDKKGRFITDLGKDDFQVIESKKPQVTQHSTAESDLPLRLALLIDTSNSIRDRFKFEQEAAVNFIERTVRPHQDKLMIVSFDSAAELVSDLIDDADKLAKAVRSLRPGGG